MRADLHRLGHHIDGPLAAGIQSTVDPDMAKRMMLVKKGKSAMILPLLVPYRPGYEQAEQSVAEQIDYCDDVPRYKVVGSLELYRFHYQPFDEDCERRMSLFSSIMANEVLPIYF